jgi:hypothetical protein
VTWPRGGGLQPPGPKPPGPFPRLHGLFYVAKALENVAGASRPRPFTGRLAP